MEKNGEGYYVFEVSLSGGCRHCIKRFGESYEKALEKIDPSYQNHGLVEKYDDRFEADEFIRSSGAGG